MKVRLHWICRGDVGSQSILRADCQTVTSIVRYSNYRFIDLPQILVMRHSKSGTRTSCSTTLKYSALSYFRKLSTAFNKYDRCEGVCKAYTAICESYVYWTVHHLDSWIKRDLLDATCFIISLFNAQHVSEELATYLLSYFMGCIALVRCYVVVWLWWCGIRMQAEALVHH